VAGFGVAAWAPLIPFAKLRLGADDGLMGLLRLCLGAGSVTAMLRTGPLCARYGCKPVVMGSGLAMSLALVSLSVIRPTMVFQYPIVVGFLFLGWTLLGIAVLILSTIVIGLGTWLKSKAVAP